MREAYQQHVETERRAHERVSVALFGRCLLANKLEIPCQAIDISPGDVGLVAGYSPELGEKVVVYLDQIGRVAGTVARSHDSGFALVFDVTPRKREKLAARIEWLKSREEFYIADERQNTRIEPRDTNSRMKLADGRSYPVEIMDISLSGAAVKAGVRPAIGADIQLAGMAGKVVRHFTEGVAIEFMATVDQDVMDERFS